MSMIDDAADQTKDAVKRAREGDEPQDESPTEESDEDARDTSGEVPVDNLE